MIHKDEKRVVIVGAGFAGIRAALDLEARKLPNTKITLIANKHHFEYYPRIYRVVTGESPLEVCIRLDEIFAGTEVDVIVDSVASVDTANHKVVGSSGSNYSYTDLVMALGSETVYFGIEGVKERAYGFKSIEEALKLKAHLHEMFDKYLASDKENLVSQLHVVVVGGGPSGVEFAGELNKYMHTLAKRHGIDNTFITVDIVEAAPRLVPMLPEDVSKKIHKRLHNLGVNIFLNRTVVKEDVDEIEMKDMSMKTNTIVWTAGSRPNHFYATVAGLDLHKSGRVLVDEYMQASKLPHVYILGDSALTKYSGLAQTAIYDGEFVADNLYREYTGKTKKKYHPKKVAYAVPVGKHWAAVSVGPFKTYGFIAWVIRQIVDLRFFLSILPLRKALRAFRSEAHLCESCETCDALITK